jgi:quercetin dioxygenase-like cupin family protein
MKMRLALYGATLCLCLAPILSAQDAVKADPKHYQVISENDQVRILKVHYAPHEKSVMHSHPAAVAVFLTDSKGQFTYPDGKKEDLAGKAGDARYTPAVTHLPENTGDKAFEVIVVELKGKAGTAKAAAKPMKAEKK